jgi:hypothetical protein
LPIDDIYGVLNTAMYSTTVYLYQQITRVLLVDTTGGYFQARYDPVYAKQLTINKGVDNVLLFEFINQDQKPVNITGSSFVFRLISQDGNELLLTKDMTILSAATGRVKVTLTTEDTINLVSQPASYSIQRTSGDYVQAVYTDANSQARADCNIVDSVFPEFQDSDNLTIPTIYGPTSWPQNPPAGWPDWALTPQPQNYTEITEFYSSEIPTNGASLTTIKMDLHHFTGTIKAQAAEDYLSAWYDVTASTQYLNETKTIYLNVEGFHPLIRVALNQSQGYGAQATATVVNGVVTGITVTDTGQNYIAAPNVLIVGNGAGAEAIGSYAGDGQIGAITVISGGSGYLPITFGSPVYANVVINNGTVTNLLYR